VTRELTIAASGVCTFIEFAVSKGAGRQALIQRSGIAEVDLSGRDNRIPFHRYVALMKAGQELCGIPALALQFGEAVDCSEIAIPCGVATTIDDAVQQANRYGRLAIEVETLGAADRFALVRDAGEVWLVDNRTNPNDFPELTESAFARMVCSTRRFAGQSSMIRAVHVTHAEPPYRSEYERIFRVPVTFGSDRNALLIDESVIARHPCPTPSKYVSAVLRDHAEELLRKLDSSQTVRGRVENVLMNVLSSGDVTVDAVAGTLGLSRQTLFRKLSAEGVTFQQLLDELRHRLALHYLIAEKSSVQRTASLLGFSDSTAFSRAFKRWTGLRPREYVAQKVPSA
jgi:AraC-like DNA-binding protein